jgi:4'-phosphopantetheinyl transferase
MVMLKKQNAAVGENLRIFKHANSSSFLIGGAAMNANAKPSLATEGASGVGWADLKIHWPAPPAQWQVEVGCVDVWVADLRRTVRQVADYAATLWPDELARAARFHFDQDRSRFIVGRGLLRAILACYVGGKPSGLAFAYGPNGKPALAQKTGQDRLFFNLSHAGDLFLLAVSRDCEVGVDLEKIRPCEEADSIAAGHFTSRENRNLRDLPASERLNAFYNLWTCKEAWLKATGDGISESLSQVEVFFSSAAPAKLVRLFGSCETLRNWSLHELAPAPGYVGALCVPADGITLKCRHWPE